MDDQARAFDTVLQCLSDNGYSVLTLVTGVLSAHNLDGQHFQDVREELERDAVDICAHLFNHATTSASVSMWAI